MQDIYTYIPETNYVPREYSVAAILLLLFMVFMWMWCGVYVVWNLVADIEGGKEAEGVWEYGVEENIWT